METILKLLIYLHILAGSFALISGPLAVGFKHGGKLHRIFGKIFFFAMILVSISATIVGLAHENYFLFIMAVFSAYLVSTGYRILYLKKLDKEQKPEKIDLFISAVMFAFSIVFLLWGAYLAYYKQSFSIVFFTFGLISFYLVRKDRKIFAAQNLEKSYWLFVHITKMIAGIIAAFTAFLVVNVKFQPGFVVWVAPTLIGGFVIRYFTTKYRMKINKGSSVEQFVEIKK